MYKMKRHRYLSAICLVAAALFSACTQDELAEQGTALPEGQYPLQIGGITISSQEEASPLTRVSETADGSVFENGDIIGVRIGDSEETGEYQLIVDETGNVTGANPITPVFWQNTGSATVTAWYPVDATIDFTHQDEKLAYLLKGSGTASYNTRASLTFAHQLAKVRVTLDGDRAGDVSAVTVNSYPSVANNEGNRGESYEGTPRYVPMFETIYNGQRCWEATLLPGTLAANNSFQLTPASGGEPVQATLTENVPIVDGSLHEITVSVVEVIHGNGYTIIPSTHTITLEGASLTSDMIRQALNGTGTLVVNGDAAITDWNIWVQNGIYNVITNLTLTNVTTLTSGSAVFMMNNLQYLDLPNATSITVSSFQAGTKLTILRLTSSETINFVSGAISINDAREITLVLNENKRDEVTNGNQWKGYTWKEILFE